MIHYHRQPPWLSLDFPDSVAPAPVDPVEAMEQPTVAAEQSLAPTVPLPRLAVIVPAYDHLDGVLRSLNSLQALAAMPHGYFVQDDASPTVFYPGLIPDALASLERNDANLGFAGNCNRAAARAMAGINGQRADLLVFINQDVQAVYGWSDGWDAALIRAFDDPSVGIVGARLLFPTGQIQSVGGTFDSMAQPVHRCLGWSNPHAPECAARRDVEWVTGAAIAVRAGLFQALGGFDESFRMYFEDVDLCLRARMAGWKVMIEPGCTLIHQPGSTGGSPHFAASARTFKARWVDSGRVKPGTMPPQQRMW